MTPLRLRSRTIDRCRFIQRLRSRRWKKAMLAALPGLSSFHQKVFWLIRCDRLTTQAASHELRVEPVMVHEVLVDVLLALGRANRT